MRRMRSLGMTCTTAFAALALIALGGCAQTHEDPAPSPALESKGTTQVNANVGSTTQISLGDVNQGVGDTWGILNDSEIADRVDATIVHGSQISGAVSSDQGTYAAPGGSSPAAVQLKLLKPGKTTVVVQYCTRTTEHVTKDCDQSHGTLTPPVKPIEITVIAHGK